MPQQMFAYAHWIVQAIFVLWITAIVWRTLRKLGDVTFDKKEMQEGLHQLLRGDNLLLPKRENASWQAVITLMRNRELSKLQFARPVPNQLLLLGLLGTVTGLSLTVWGLVPILRDHGAPFEEVNRQLADSLQYMSTAFVCTLAGLLGALTVNAKTQEKLRELVQLLPEWEYELLEKIAKDAPFLTAVTVAKLQESVDAFNNSLTPRVSGLSDSVKALQDAIDKMAPSLKEASDAFAKALDSAKEAMEASASKLAENSTKVEASLSMAAEAVNGSVKELKASSDGLKEQHKELVAAHAALTLAFSSWKTDVEQFIEDQTEQVKKFSDIVHEKATEIVGQIVSTAEKLKETAEAFAQAEKMFEDQGTQIQSAWEHHFGKLKEYLHEVTASLKTLFTEDVDRLFKDHRFALDEVERALQGIQAALGQANHHLETVGAFANAAPTASNGEIAKLIEALQELRKTIQSGEADLSALKASQSTAIEGLVDGAASGGKPSIKKLVGMKPLQEPDTEPPATGP